MTAANETYIKKLVEDSKDRYAPLHAQIRHNRQIRYAKLAPLVPVAYRSSTTDTRSPIAEDILLRVTATLTADEPIIKVPPYGNTEKSKRNSSQRERWSQAAMRQMEREARRPVYRMLMDNAVADGLAIPKLIDRADVWRGLVARKADEDPDKYLERVAKHKKGSPFPFMLADIDPLTYYETATGYGEFHAVEITERAALPMMERFDVWRDSNRSFVKGRRLGEPMPNDNNYAAQTWELTEYWRDDGSMVTYMLDGEIVDERKLNYPRPPYFRFGGHMTSSREPSEAYRSVIQPFAHLIPTLNALLTMATNRVYLFAYPFLRRRDSTQRITQRGPVDPTSVTKIRPGALLDNVEFMGEIGPSSILGDMLDKIMMMIDRSGLAAVMYGQGASSSSGYMVSQLMTAAQLVYAPIIDNAKMSLQDLIPFMWKLIERRNMGTVYVWGAGEGKEQSDWLGLGPKDVDGYYACEVNIKPRLPLDEIAERASAAMMVERELWSKRYALEHLGHEQPEELLDEVEVEHAKYSDRVRGPLAERMALESGIDLPAPPTPVAPQGPPFLDQFGNPMPLGGGGGGIPGGIPGVMGGPMGPGGMPGGLGITPTVPGVNAPLVPPPPPGTGMMPPGGM